MESSHLVIFSTSGKFITKFNVLRCISLTLSGPGFEKLAQTGGGADSAPPLLTSLPCIRTKPNLVWENTIIWQVLVQNFKCFG